MQRRGFLAYGVRGDIAPLLVGRPCWTRLNSFVLTPDSPASQPVTDAVIVTGYLLRYEPSKTALALSRPVPQAFPGALPLNALYPVPR